MDTNFYKSKPWVELMRVLRLERVADDGLLYCEHCGKPIIAKYDCIGHHIIELTDDNVHDANIALNPENIMLVHHRCHNKIHNKLGIGAKKVYLVYGSPLSGKTTFVHDNMDEGDLIVDMDNIWQCISGCERYVKPNRLKQNAFAIRDQLIDMIRIRRGNWLTAWLIGGYPLISERERLCKSLGAREIFIDTPKEECIRRASERSEEWLGFVNNWYDQYTPPPFYQNST